MIVLFGLSNDGPSSRVQEFDLGKVYSLECLVNLIGEQRKAEKTGLRLKNGQEKMLLKRCTLRFCDIRRKM